MFFSLKLARKLQENVAFRVLGEGNFPAHLNLCDFRVLYIDALAAFFEQAFRLARECGLVNFATIAIDGTKVKA